MTYSWHRVNGHLPSRSTGQHSGTLTINRATPYDEGLYYCMSSKEGIIVKSDNSLVKIDGKELHNSWNLSYYMGLYVDMLSVSVTPSGTVVHNEGETVRLTATASGINETNSFKYQWRKRGNGSPSDVTVGVNNPVLVISGLSTSDEGDYYCNVTNEWGRSVLSNATILFVEGMNHPDIRSSMLYNKTMMY